MISLPQPVFRRNFRIIFHIPDSEEKVVEVLKGTNLNILSIMLESYSADDIIREFSLCLRIPTDEIREFYFCLDNLVSYDLEILDTNTDMVIRSQHFIIDKIIQRYTEYDYADSDVAQIKIKGIYK